jgi:hypothetical protein
MFRVDKSVFEYMKDLSNPDVKSSSDMESIDLKRDIIKINFLTLVIGIFVVFVIINLFLFYLPGLFNVFIQIVWYYVATLFVYWKLLLIALVVLVVLIFLSLRHS